MNLLARVFSKFCLDSIHFCVDWMYFFVTSDAAKCWPITVFCTCFQLEQNVLFEPADMHNTHMGKLELRMRSNSGACTPPAKAQVTIGPWIDNGFFYDFDMQGEAFEDKDLKAIKKEMIKIINKVRAFALISSTYVCLVLQ
jgi:hypothetical protein